MDWSLKAEGQSKYEEHSNHAWCAAATVGSSEDPGDKGLRRGAAHEEGTMLWMFSPSHLDFMRKHWKILSKTRCFAICWRKQMRASLEEKRPLGSYCNNLGQDMSWTCCSWDGSRKGQKIQGKNIKEILKIQTVKICKLISYGGEIRERTTKKNINSVPSLYLLIFIFHPTHIC